METFATQGPGIDDGGAAAAFETFFREAEPMLRKVAVTYVREPTAAHDLVQETLARAWNDWTKIRCHPHPDAWCRTVLHNLAVSSWRRQRLEGLWQGAVHPVETPGVENLDLLDALRRLPPKPRRAVVLYHILGFTSDEVAHEMGLSAGGVRSMLSRARQTLAEQLADRRA